MTGRPRGLFRTWEHVACPTCGAPVGDKCRTVRTHLIRLSYPGHPTYPPHIARRQLADRTAPPLWRQHRLPDTG